MEKAVMTDEIAAFAVTKVLGTKISGDRKHLLVHVGQSPGEPVWLSFPIEQASNLAAAGGAGIAAITPNVMNDGKKPYFEVSWWELGKEVASGAMVLSLTFEAGAKLHFRLRPPMPQAILETLQATLQEYTVRMPGIQPN
jgi:hypothetical protein